MFCWEQGIHVDVILTHDTHLNIVDQVHSFMAVVFPVYVSMSVAYFSVMHTAHFRPHLSMSSVYMFTLVKLNYCVLCMRIVQMS